MIRLLMPITGLVIQFPDVYFRAIDYKMFADFTEERLNVAQNIEFIGYPDNRYDSFNNLPLIRTGIISSYPKIDYNGEPVFIIDAQVFPGSSGSPVMINLSFEHWKTGSLSVEKPQYKLLGVVAATMIRNNRLQAVNTTTWPDIGTQEVIGLGIVFKSTALKEIIDKIPL